MSGRITIKSLGTEDEAVRGLIRQSDELLASLYVAESNQLESLNDLKRIGVRFIGAYNSNGLVGCGAVKIVRVSESYAEIKRLFVSKEHRGKGISLVLMHHLEDFVRDCGIVSVKLETGIKQPEAISLYKKLGYSLCEAFGCYRADPLSVFMQKRLH